MIGVLMVFSTKSSLKSQIFYWLGVIRIIVEEKLSVIFVDPDIYDINKQFFKQD